MRPGGRDNEFLKKAAEHGKSLILNFSRLVRMSGMYDNINDAMLKSASALLEDIAVFTGQEGEVTLKMAEGSFFLDDMRVKGSVQDIEQFAPLVKDMEKRKIGVIAFKAPLSTDDVIFLAYSIKGAEEAGQIQSALESKLTKGVSVGGPVFLSSENPVEHTDTRVIASRAYAMAVSACVDIEKSVKEGRRIDLKKAKRAFQAIANGIRKDEKYILGLAGIRDIKSYHYHHSVNVAILSIALGMRVGLGRYHLGRLGLSALMHDIGLTLLEPETLDKPEALSGEETEQFYQHPAYGVKAVLHSMGLNDISSTVITVSYEHHQNLDFSGFPKFSAHSKQNLYSRIIRIADEYDTLVSGRVFKRTAAHPGAVLKNMYDRRTTHFDPSLLAAFIDIFTK